MSSISIALDAMGGDHGPKVVVPAAIEYLRKDPDIRLILVGREESIQKYLPRKYRKDERLVIHPASQEVGMDELPSRALRNKKDSSMRVAIDLVKAGEVEACVSAGNTGALMATARFVLKMLPHVDRPAIIAAIPSTTDRTWMLDLGANVDCSAEHLFQFAVMGAELVTAVDGKSAPKVGLLNIGQEEIKGNEQVKEAHDLLSDSNLNYVGYVEGDDIFLGDIDLVVADGFVGNVALKTSEGVAKLIRDIMRSEFGASPLARLASIITLPVIRNLRKRLDPRRHNGASLLGLRGIVVKSHGGTDKLGFSNAISIAKKEVTAKVADRIESRVAVQLSKQGQLVEFPA